MCHPTRGWGLLGCLISHVPALSLSPSFPVAALHNADMFIISKEHWLHSFYALTISPECDREYRETNKRSGDADVRQRGWILCWFHPYREIRAWKHWCWSDLSISTDQYLCLGWIQGDLVTSVSSLRSLALRPNHHPQLCSCSRHSVNCVFNKTMSQLGPWRKYTECTPTNHNQTLLNSETRPSIR